MVSGRVSRRARKTDDKDKFSPVAAFYDEYGEHKCLNKLDAVNAVQLASQFGINKDDVVLCNFDRDPTFPDERGTFVNLEENETYYVVDRFLRVPVLVNAEKKTVGVPRFELKFTVKQLVDEVVGGDAQWQHFRVTKFTANGSAVSVENESEMVQPYCQYNVDDLTKWPTVTMLVLGETGVGKSTWINGIANYVVHDNLEDAINGDMIHVIPTQFSITRQGKMKKIRVGEENPEHEILAIGKSATQSPSVYTFYDDERRRILRLIDTPGIGDVEGQQKDDENFKKIVDCVARENTINGICILLKPNTARLGAVFKYCINELLAHLSRSATPNIALCFTNTRGTFYEPGDTFPILCDYVADLEKKGSKIPLNEYFCFDNEAFRFLACVKNGVDITTVEKARYTESWKKSVDTTTALFDHFQAITPHFTRDTVLVNRARDSILAITPSLANLSRLIQDNITAIADKNAELKAIELQNVDLNSKLMIPHIAYESIPINYPRTVCTGPNCTTTVSVEGATHTIYSKICHASCYCPTGYVVPDRFPEPGLQKCSAMSNDVAGFKCTVCGCLWNVHVHIRYIQEQKYTMVEDELVVKELKANKVKEEDAKLFRETLEARVQLFKEEQKAIKEICAKAATFLRNSSILPYNDAVEDYLELMMKEEKRKVRINEDAIDSLEANLAAYKQQRAILEDAMKSPEAVSDFTPGDFLGLKDRLSKLPKYGPTLKKAMDSACLSNHNHYADIIANKCTRGKGFAKSWFEKAKCVASEHLSSIMKDN